MLCFICNKNSATIHIEEVVNGVKKATHLCEACAIEKGLNLLSKPEVIGLAEFLHNISSDSMKSLQTSAAGDSETKEEGVLVCSKCGWDSERVRNVGRLGCSECYHIFGDKFVPSLLAMHRGVDHCGKFPASIVYGRNILVENMSKLQKKLEKHIRNEEYEEAARVRDRLNDLKSERVGS